MSNSFALTLMIESLDLRRGGRSLHSVDFCTCNLGVQHVARLKLTAAIDVTLRREGGSTFYLLGISVSKHGGK